MKTKDYEVMDHVIHVNYSNGEIIRKNDRGIVVRFRAKEEFFPYKKANKELKTA